MRLILAALLASGLYGQLTDRDVHPDTATPFPTTAGSTFDDSVFGTHLVRITDTDDGPSCFTRYSYWPVFNSDKTKILFSCYTTDFYTYWKSFNPTTKAVGSKVEIVKLGDDASWSRSDPDILFYHNSSQQLIAYDVVSKTASWTDTPTSDHPTWTISQLRVAKDDDLFSMHMKAGGTAAVAFGVWRHSTQSWLYLNEDPSALCTVGADVLDEVAVSQNGQYLYAKCDGADNAQRIRLSDGAVLGIATSGHADQGDDWFSVFWGGGSPYMIGQVKYDFATNTKTDQFLLNLATEYAANGLHVSALGTTQNWILVSMDCLDSSGTPQYQCDTTIDRPFQRELVMAQANGGGGVRRLVHHRADPTATCTPGLGGGAYRCYPFGALSFDEQMFAFNSTDGHGGAVHVYVGYTGTAPINNMTTFSWTGGGFTGLKIGQ